MCCSCCSQVYIMCLRLFILVFNSSVYDTFCCILVPYLCTCGHRHVKVGRRQKDDKNSQFPVCINYVPLTFQTIKYCFSTFVLSCNNTGTYACLTNTVYLKLGHGYKTTYRRFLWIAKKKKPYQCHILDELRYGWINKHQGPISIPYFS